MGYEILIVDDQEDIRQLIADILSEAGYHVRTASDSREALESIRAHPPHLVILDIWLNDSRFDGIAILDIIKQNFPDVAVVMISGHGNIETAVACLKKGAYDFIEKPFHTNRLLSIVAKGIEISKLYREVAELKKRTSIVEELHGISSHIEILRKNLSRVAKSNSRILIEGPPGAGKEVAARLIHRQSQRANKPFIVVNCASLDQQKLAATLFGSEENVGSPNLSIRIGLLEKAHSGTLCLDNVAEMPKDVQAKFLHLLHHQQFQRVGGEKFIEVDTRIISLSSVPLDSYVESKRFREDLFYRLNVVRIQIPPLYKRKEDIPALFTYFADKFCQENHRPSLKLSEEALLYLQNYTWPGNIRQLRNVVEWLSIMTPDDTQVIEKASLPTEIYKGDLSPGPSYSENIINLPLRKAREVFERDYIALQINRFHGNIAKTAQIIGMERTALHRKIKSLKLAGYQGEHEE